jgi:three-Cys-motif partner protein
VSKHDETVWELEDHTLAKHRILRSYLEAWLPIMSSWCPRLVLIDGFAGPGVYAKGEPGSPIHMLNAYLEHERRNLIKTELVYAFIEQDTERFKSLQAEVGKLTIPSHVHVRLYNEPFERVFGGILDDLTARAATLAPTFAFIDPFGYTGAPMELTGRFLRFDRCEVLIYVPLPWINRFLSREGQGTALTSFFGTDRWRDAVELAGDDRIRFLHDLFKAQLETQCELDYVRSFEIVTAKNRGYHLFFGTKELKGLEKMKDVMWSVDPASGDRFRDSTIKGLMPLFEPEPDTGPLGDALRNRFASTVFTIDEAERFTLIDTPYKKSHLKRKTLAPLEKAGELEPVDPPAGRKTRTYRPGTRLRFV